MLGNGPVKQQSLARHRGDTKISKICSDYLVSEVFYLRIDFSEPYVKTLYYNRYRVCVHFSLVPAIINNKIIKLKSRDC
jgi:hypothetical protein